MATFSTLDRDYDALSLEYLQSFSPYNYGQLDLPFGKRKIQTTKQTIKRIQGSGLLNIADVELYHFK